jgi:hypothetical protein
MMTGEYFLSDKAKENIEREKKREAKEQRKLDKIQEKMKVFEAPPEEEVQPKKEEKLSAKSSKPDIDELKKKFLKKKQ